MKMDRVTLTGADDSADPKRMIELSEQFPFVEWGILISASQSGGHRFPSPKWLRDMLGATAAYNLKLSAHLCGGWVREFVNDGKYQVKRDLLEHDIPLVAFKRVQLNFHGEKHFPLNGRHEYLDIIANERHQFIFQQDGVNDQLFYRSQRAGLNTVPLCDTSHGAGIVPKEWPAPIAQYQGYAGGLGPENVLTELAKIRAACSNWLWIDMETKLYTGGVFDFDKCKKVLELTAPFIGEEGL